MKAPKTYWGLPVDAEAPAERGIALLIAIMIISIMMLFTSDLILSSQVNVTLATTTRDNLKAEYLAKSGLNAASLLISADFAFNLFQMQQDPKADLVTTVGGVWSALNGFPIGGDTADMAAKFTEGLGLNAVMDSGVIDQLKLFDGMFTIDATDEGRRINVNDCYDGRCSEVMLMLEALMSCPAEKAFLDHKKVTGRELSYRIKDYIDKDLRAEEASGFNDENEPYAKRTPKQAAKNASLDTVDELRMVEGWDEEIHEVFSPYLTAYPFHRNSTDRQFKLNINTASRAMLQCLFPEARGDCAEKVALLFHKRDTMQSPLATPGQKISDILRTSLCYGAGDGNPGEVSNRVGWFAQHSTAFRIVVDGTVGESSRRATMVVERVIPDPSKGDKSSVRILHLKIR